MKLKINIAVKKNNNFKNYRTTKVYIIHEIFVAYEWLEIK
jgi:hypothetical protein